jgi:hypothetical protein
MGTFDAFADATGQLKREGETITLDFSPGLPVTGQGTIAWNLPTLAHGCQVNDGRGEYCGMVITLSTAPHEHTQAPVDGTFYTSDATADFDKHVGDRINNALVIGAFYEGEKVARGEDLTTSFILSDLIPNQPYYIIGYAVDCQGRYHTEGVRAYSSEYGNTDATDSASFQIVQLNAGQGVLPTDGTNLVPGIIYEFDIEINENFPQDADPGSIINVKVNGIDVQTYTDLIDNINAQLALAENPVQSPVPPNTGSYLWDSTDKQLSQFNGTIYEPLDAIYEPTDPTQIITGSYWYDNTTNLLQQWDIPVPTSWNIIPHIKYHQDLNNLGCDDYWFNGTLGYNYNGSTWCQLETLIDATDPAIPPPPECGTFWYDENISTLFEWNIDLQQWVERPAIFWPEAPNSLSAGTFWFDLNTQMLFQRGGGVWISQPTALIQETTPISPAVGLLWFNPATEELKQWDGATFVDQNVLVWLDDPTTTQSCDLWWNSTSDLLFTWDIVNNEWDEVVKFVQSTLDPTCPPVIKVNSVWYDSTNNILQRWDGNQWIVVTFITALTDPTQLVLGSVWQNTTTGVWQIWDTPIAGWNIIDPIDLDSDPNNIPTGTFWFDSTNDIVFQRVGISWVAIPFTTSPLSHKIGDTWFDATTKMLKKWNGIAWVLTQSIVAIGLNKTGDLVFMSRLLGSCACTMLLIPGGGVLPSQRGTGFADFHSYGHYDSYSEASFTAPELPDTDVSEDAFLFNNLPSQVFPQVYGKDGLPGVPSYEIVGVGSDGTPDERRELADSMRAQLGYPVVDVELTPYQMDEAITSALESLRKRSDIAYTRGFFFMDIEPGNQSYKLTNKKAGFHKIVGITSAHRFTSAFLSSSHGAGVYGQVVLQHLYNMGTYDLTSFHLVSQYVEQLEHLFATRMTFHWDESSRLLHLHQTFVRRERILLDCFVERTEQDILTDRWCKTWVEKFALAQCRFMLAEIRGKFASLPGAGGGIALNAADLATRAETDMADCYQQLEDMIASNIEDFGMGTTFLIG